ncbi:MAG: hypothetical protein HUK22_01695 [Thermoguttaceae bacterium]|nr:hypothetical protein [Thermoguttaceae bacterium]
MQLSEEFENSTSPHIRRACLDAVARISEQYQNPVAEKVYRQALESDDLNLALSACNAWGDYCAPIAEERPEARKLGAELLADRYKRRPYSIAAGSEEENKLRKDLRVAILRNMGKFKPSDSPVVLETLEAGINGEKLDDGALQDAAMCALKKSTGKNYGLDAELWLKYLAYERGEISTAPEELSMFERLPKIESAAFK